MRALNRGDETERDSSHQRDEESKDEYCAVDCDRFHLRDGNGNERSQYPDASQGEEQT